MTMNTNKTQPFASKRAGNKAKQGIRAHPRSTTQSPMTARFPSRVCWVSTKGAPVDGVLVSVHLIRGLVVE
mgnify:CR=1 FL=1